MTVFIAYAVILILISQHPWMAVVIGAILGRAD